MPHKLEIRRLFLGVFERTLCGVWNTAILLSALTISQQSQCAPKWTTLALLFYADESICSSELFLKALQIRLHFRAVLRAFSWARVLMVKHILKHTQEDEVTFNCLHYLLITQYISTMISSSVCSLHSMNMIIIAQLETQARIFHASCWANLPCSIIHLLEKLMTLNFSYRSENSEKGLISEQR